MEAIKTLIVIFLLTLFAGYVYSDELANRRNDMALVKSRIELERVRYQEAKAKMERSELVAKYLLPELQEREKVLQEKITKLETEKKNKQENK